jgi:hypothetical protein
LSTKKYINANIVKENKEKADGIAEIAKVYDKRMNEAIADGLTQLPRVLEVT